MTKKFEQKLQAMSEKFRMDLSTRFSEIDTLFEQVIEPLPTENIASLKQLLHRLTGSAGSFGLDKISHASLKLDIFLNSAFSVQSTSLSKENKEILLHLRDQLALEVQLSALCNDYIPAIHLPSSNADSAEPRAHNARRIVIIEDDEQQAVRYHTLLNAQDYDVTIIADPELHKCDEYGCCADMPILFIVDMMLGERKYAGAEFIGSLQQRGHSLPPVIFASVFDDFDTRLRAVRAGGSRYLVKPFSDTQLLNSVRSLTEKETPPYRVLIIDDEQELANYFVAIMENAGMIAQAINNPMDAITKVKQFEPELILMDIHMPICNGLELATMIRHQESYAQIPIFFLSADYQLQNRLSAIAIGADDFIQKGIEPYQLVVSVKARLNKARLINTLTDKLIYARKKAESANQSKSNFLSFISHELKTPLNATLGYSQLLSMEDLTLDQQEMVADIYASGKIQLSLINDLLDLSMIEERKLKFNLEYVNLNHEINKVLALIKLSAQQRNISIEIDIADQVEVEVDVKRLQQVLLNLLSNAVKYNKNNGKIKLTVIKTETAIIMSIADTGLGISESSLVAIFTPFERNGTEKTNIEGTGLGLGITKKLVELMGGSITVSSRLNEGSTFTITLPATISNLASSDNK